MGTDSADGLTSAGRTVLLIGDATRSEMQSLVAWLKDLILDASHLIEVRDIPSVQTQLTNNEFPDLIVVLQSWSNEFTVAEINELFAFAPLARVVVCYGAWCESDGRNHKSWPLAVRIPAWGARPRLTREWNLIRRPDGTAPLPWSASREEIFAADHPPVLSSATRQHVLIETPDPAYRIFLGELLSAEGHTVVEADPSVILFDADPWCPSRAEALRLLVSQYPQKRIYGIASLIQPQLEAELKAIGVSRLLPKLGEAIQM